MKRVAGADPDNLAVVKGRLHTVSGDPDPEIRAFRNLTFGKAEHFEMIAFQQAAAARRHGKVVNAHLNRFQSGRKRP